MHPRGCLAMFQPHFVPMCTVDSVFSIAGARLVHCSTAAMPHRHAHAEEQTAKAYQPAVHITNPTRRKSRATAEATFLSVCHNPLLNLQQQQMKVKSRELANNNVS